MLCKTVFLSLDIYLSLASYLAHCYPYKYTDLMEDLKHLKSDPVRGKCLSEKVLCQTLAGNDVPVVTITSHKSVGDVKYKQGKQRTVSRDTFSSQTSNEQINNKAVDK